MLLKASALILWQQKRENMQTMKYNIMKYLSALNYYTDRSSQWKMFLEIDVPKTISKTIKKYK